MCWADINLNVDGEGQEYLEFVERQTKTRTGDNPKDVRKVTPKMWSNLEYISRCLVEVYAPVRDSWGIAGLKCRAITF